LKPKANKNFHRRKPTTYYYCLSLSLEFNTLNFLENNTLELNLLCSVEVHFSDCIEVFIASNPDRASPSKSTASRYRFCGTLCVRWASEWHRMPNPSCPSPSIEALHARSLAVQSQTALPTATAILIEKHLSHFSISFQFLRIGKADQKHLSHFSISFQFLRIGQCKMSICFLPKSQSFV
jgi:hypothetical protein